MAMLNNQMVYMCMCIYIYINGTTNRQNRQAPDKPIGATCHVDALYTDIWWICWFHSPSILHDLHCHLDCFKKQPGCPAARSWHRPAIKHEMLQKMGISNSNFQLRFPKKNRPRLPWFPPCRKSHGFEKGRKRALVRPVPCQVPGQPRSWKNMAIGLVSREILLENFVFAWFYHGFYLSKWLNMWVSWKKCPKIAMPKGTQMKQVTFHCYAWLPQGWVYRMEMPCSYGFPPWENLSYQYH